MISVRYISVRQITYTDETVIYIGIHRLFFENRIKKQRHFNRIASETANTP